jgi:hypothetical protein
LGILEYINLNDLNENEYEIKKVILGREQYYLDILNPSLNINKIAGSTLGYKHSEEMRKTMGLQRRGKSINWERRNYIISDTTKNNLSLSARNGITVKVFDKHNIVINVFPTLTSAAKHYDVDH